MAGYGRREPSGWDVAMQGMNFLGNAMEAGQRIGAERKRVDEEAGLSEAYDYIAEKLGTTGDISQLDGDPVLQTGRGLRALSKFSTDRLTTEEGRNAALKKMSDSDDFVWRNNILPNLHTAKQAYQNKDMTTFSSAIAEASKYGGPHRLEQDGSGGFNVMFRSDAAGKWVATGRKLTADEAMQQGDYYIGGEVKTLAGANGEMLSFNPRVNSMRARSRMATITGNAENYLDTSKQFVLSKGGKQFTGIIQNDINYMNPPALIVTDDKDKVVGQFSVDQLGSAGFSSLGTKKDWMKAQESKRGRGVGGGSGAGGMGGMPFKVSDADQKWADGEATTEDASGNKATNPYIGMALLTLMGQFGQSRYAALLAYQNGVKSIIEQLRREAPDMPAEQMQQFAAQRFCDYLKERGQGGQATQKPPTAGGSAQQAQISAPQAPASGANNLHNTVRDVAGGSGQATTRAEEEPITPEERHRRIVEGGVELTRGIPGALREGFEWWQNSIKNNAE